MIAGAFVALGFSAAISIEIASTNAPGRPADGGSFDPSLSADARYVAFESDAANLVTNDANAMRDVFRKDRTTGAVQLVSTSAQGSGANGFSRDAAISADGARVAFRSSASNLIASDANGVDDVFVRDLALGATLRASVGPVGIEANGASEDPAISSDGRLVAFESVASNLVVGDANGFPDVFVRDLRARKTIRVSVDSSGAEADGPSGGSIAGVPDVAISGNGRFVAFVSAATNLVAGDTNSSTDVFVHDLVTGATTRASLRDDGGQANGGSEAPSISFDGARVAFQSWADDLVAGDANFTHDVFVRDLATSATLVVSVDSGGSLGDFASVLPAISSDGARVAFTSFASNLASGDVNATGDVFVHDLAAATTTLTSRSTAGTTGNGLSELPALSADGRWVAFYSFADDLVAGDANGFPDVFVVDAEAP